MSFGTKVALFMGLIACTMLAIWFEPYKHDTEPGLYITVYDWALGGHNCNEDCGQTSLTTTGPELYGWTAACPVEWLGYINTTVVTIWGQEFWCIDTFGTVENQQLTKVDGRPVYRIDLAYSPASSHPWNNEWVPDTEWSRRWEPMSKFYQLREAAKGE